MPERRMGSDKKGNNCISKGHINNAITRAPPSGCFHTTILEDRNWTEMLLFCVSGIIFDLAEMRLERLKELEKQTSESE